MCGGFHENVLPEDGALPRILGKVEDYSFKEKYNMGEGDHFPSVLIRTFKYFDMHRGKSRLDDVFLKTL